MFANHVYHTSIADLQRMEQAHAPPGNPSSAAWVLTPGIAGAILLGAAVLERAEEGPASPPLSRRPYPVLRSAPPFSPSSSSERSRHGAMVQLALPKLAVITAMGLVGALMLSVLPFEFRRARRENRSLITGTGRGYEQLTRIIITRAANDGFLVQGRSRGFIAGISCSAVSPAGRSHRLVDAPTAGHSAT